MKRKILFDEIEQLLHEFCHECFLYKHNKEEKGRTFAHRFCIQNCTVGEKMKIIGSKLTEGKEQNGSRTKT